MDGSGKRRPVTLYGGTGRMTLLRKIEMITTTDYCLFIVTEISLLCSLLLSGGEGKGPNFQ